MMDDATNSVYVIHDDDNVATALCDIPEGPVTILGARGGSLAAVQAIPKGHKIALQAIKQDDLVIKYGVNIARAKRFIAQGEHVHVHNIASLTDERTSNFDSESATPQDMRYTLDDQG
jgi:altronate dehydratase small subunit